MARDARRRLALPVVAALLLTLGCGRPRSQPSDSVAARDGAAADSAGASAPSSASGAAMSGLTGRDWTLVSLDDGDEEPIEATQRPVTLRLDEASGRATGYAGCNRYGGPYTLSGDSLSFGPAAMTKMACSTGMSTEQRYAAVLPNVARYRIADSTLVLLDGSGRAVATFSAQ